MEHACQKFPEVTLIDHHQTALDYVCRMANIPDNLHIVLVLEHSGCMLAYNEFKPNISDNLKELLNYVEDNDLWKHQLTNSKLFTLGLNSLKYDPIHTSFFDQIPNLSAEWLIALGEQELERKNEYFAEHLVRCKQVELKESGLLIQLLEFTKVPEYISDLGHALADMSPSKMGIVAFPIENGERMKLSVRSIGDVDTIQFTSRYNGGGHKNASGCSMTIEEFQKTFFIN